VTGESSTKSVTGKVSVTFSKSLLSSVYSKIGQADVTETVSVTPAEFRSLRRSFGHSGGVSVTPAAVSVTPGERPGESPKSHPKGPLQGRPPNQSKSQFRSLRRQFRSLRRKGSGGWGAGIYSWEVCWSRAAGGHAAWRLSAQSS
jgi:hypothetical protein